MALVLCGQFFAMAALALKVNDDYLFYTSWADLTGHVSQKSPIETGGLVRHGQGHLRVMTVPSHDTGSQHQVLVWLPPQYDLAAYRNQRFPVVTFLTGQPSTPQTAFARFKFASTAMRLIDTHRTQPFVGVFPTLMISPPRDTECTNVPGGPRAETWLANEVPRFIQQHFRVAGPGPAWTTMGWSTGGASARPSWCCRTRTSSGRRSASVATTSPCRTGRRAACSVAGSAWRCTTRPNGSTCTTGVARGAAAGGVRASGPGHVEVDGEDDPDHRG
ncbi:esterase family protein [Nocardioides panacis]|uniref:Esterase family protein n=1 Tax=Nocardioides panacis TaxID=2849501 RepID=A0A975T1V0_9ACTN|nr:alpha/beta hydrolase-fold protein [Nocardioides panacis]QWZ09961.1 esterase family protein [Nocardioides panacis]